MYSAAGLQVCPRPNSGAQRSTGDLSPESRALSFGACPLRSPLPPPVTAVSPQTASTPTHRLRPLSLCPRVVLARGAAAFSVAAPVAQSAQGQARTRADLLGVLGGRAGALSLVADIQLFENCRRKGRSNSRCHDADAVLHSVL